VSPELLVLWDVDHTLIENGGVSSEAYRKAFELLAGRPATEPFSTDGRTDWLIIEELLERHGVELTEELRARVEPALVEALTSLEPGLRERGHALAGAREALAAVGKDDRFAQSALTGNIRPNAVTKLAAFDLDTFLDFDLGGYGSDHETRSKLVGFAQGRAAGRYGRPFDKASTVLIGDTPLDVRAGLDGGAKVVGVATGKTTENELREAGADVTLPDLRDTEALLSALTALIPSPH
jgi:phosphoglycolate phosphatase